MRILGVETSCDETAVAVYDQHLGLLAHTLHSQIALHQRYGGVVPELASRDHIRILLPLIKQTLNSANTPLTALNAIAYTAGPGLVGALMVGATVARSLAYGLNIPALSIHHLEGHLLAPMLETNPPTYPFLALLVSGGHTLLIHVKQLGEYQLLGQTLDDAAGEAFDKTAKLLGLPYPGGPAIAKLAATSDGKPFVFSRPMIDRPTLDFSFSGLKTQVAQTFQKSDKSPTTCAAIAHALQDAIVDTLVLKSEKALKQTQLKRLVVAGGVGANQQLRKRLQEFSEKNDIELFFPRPEFCTDNAAMIAFAGLQHFIAGQRDDLGIQVRARWPLVS